MTLPYQLLAVSVLVFVLGMICILFQKNVIGVASPKKIQAFVFLTIYWAWVLSFFAIIGSFVWIVRTYR